MRLLVLNLQNVAETPSVTTDAWAPANSASNNFRSSSPEDASISRRDDTETMTCDMWHVMSWWRVISVIPDTFTMITLSESALYILYLSPPVVVLLQPIEISSGPSPQSYIGILLSWILMRESFLICKMILKNVHWGKNVPTLWQILQFRLVSFRSKHLLNESVLELPRSMQIEHFQADPC